jgi:hypothetical protein
VTPRVNLVGIQEFRCCLAGALDRVRHFDMTYRRGYNPVALCCSCRMGAEERRSSMAKKKSQRRDWRVIIFLSVSLMIVLFMVLSAILPALLAN